MVAGGECLREANHTLYLTIADLLDRFVNDEVSPYEWDDFVSVPEKDPLLEAIRFECASLPERFPPRSQTEYCGEGCDARLHELSALLRARATTEP
jgi:hypothetical protein